MDSIIDAYLKVVETLKCKWETLLNKAIEMYHSDKFAFIRGLNFKSKHFTQICFASLLAFFITFYITDLYTSDVKAYNVSDSIHIYNVEPYEYSYGDTNTYSSIVKDILAEKVSVVSNAVVKDANPMHTVLEVDHYIAEIIPCEKILGEVFAEIRLYTKNTYYSGQSQLATLYCNDRFAEIKDGMVCIYKVSLSVSDTVAPVISLSTYDTTIKETDSFNQDAYVRSIIDNFDGNILDYTVSGNDVGKNGDLLVGKHVLTYTAKDSSGNTTSAQLIVRVKAKAKKVTYSNNVASRPYAGNIVAEARSLIGSAYVWGATGPYAFDCSGLVQYVYKRAGVYVPRTSGSQAHYGASINPYDMSQWRAGDIITFGPAGSQHAAIYTGNGTMVHAINPAYGVRETGVYGDIYSVRRP